MINIIDKSLCCGCTSCANSCAKNAIKMIIDEKGFKYPEVDKSLCVDCGKCNKVCPIESPIIPSPFPRKSYACKNKDLLVRTDSTSGGLFSLLAEYVLDYNGYVFGAVFDSEWFVCHSCAHSVDEIKPMRGSKYVQSDLNETYYEVKKLLKEGYKVLFTGLPCQCAGLKSFLQHDYINLILVDMICMGVGSPKVWKNYLDCFEDVKAIKSIIFKSKKIGWHDWRMAVSHNDEVLYQKGTDNLFFNGYLKHLFYRESCHKCNFKGFERCSDLTIADAWGIEKYNDKFDDDKGCSLVIVQSEKGEKVLESLRQKLDYIIFPKEVVLKYNPYVERCAEYNPFTSDFYQLLNKGETQNAFLKYAGKLTISRSIAYKLNLLFHRFKLIIK